MSEAKFTKGPWKVVHDRDSTPGCGKFPTVENDAGDQVISGDWHSSLTSENTGFDSSADLNLIAAAPEMYDALDDTFLNNDLSDEQFTVIESLLAKARGVHG